MNKNNLAVAAELPHFLPALPFFLRMAASDVFFLADLLPFSSRSPVQRAQIIIQDDLKWLTIPVFNKKQNPINEIRIDYHQNWGNKIVRRIKSAFHNFPFFDEFFPRLEAIFFEKSPLLFDLNYKLILWFKEIWNIESNIKLLSDISTTIPNVDLPVFLCNSSNSKSYIVDHFNRPFINYEQMKTSAITVIDMDYEVSIPLELRANQTVSAINMLFKHGPLPSVLFKEIYSNAQKSIVRK